MGITSVLIINFFCKTFLKKSLKSAAKNFSFANFPLPGDFSEKIPREVLACRRIVVMKGSYDAAITGSQTALFFILHRHEFFSLQ